MHVCNQCLLKKIYVLLTPSELKNSDLADNFQLEQGMYRNQDKNDEFGQNSMAKNITILLLIAYLFGLIWILLFKLNVHFTYMKHWSHFNLIPYHDPMRIHGKTAISELILNVIIFIPFGIYLEVLCHEWKFWRKILSYFLVSLLIETLQNLLQIGAFDITDIINNTLGGILGTLGCIAFVKLLKNRMLVHKIINSIAAIGTVLIFSTILFLKVNKLLMFRH